MPAPLNIPRKNPNDLVSADEFNELVDRANEAVVTTADLGLENVNNTSDLNKPISNAVQAALNNKENNLGYTPENPNNKVVDLATPNNTTYPTTLAVSNAIFEAVSDSDAIVTDATSSVKGKIKLAGDLGGTADAPTVPGLAAKQNTLPTGTANQYIKADLTVGTFNTDIIAEGTTNKYLTSTERNKLAGISAGATVNDSDVNLKNRANHTGTQTADTIIDGTTNKVFTATEKTKLTGIATGATVNSADATLLARANHTGTQSADSIIDGTTNKAYTATEKTKLSGIATGATVNDTDVNLKARANHTGTQSADTIIDGTTNKVFTSANQTKLNGIATAATANSTDASLRDRSTHTGTQAQSTITNLTTDLAAKQATLVSGTSIKTVGGSSLLGSGNIDVPILVGGVIDENDLPLVDLTPEFNPEQFEEYTHGVGDQRIQIIPAILDSLNLMNQLITRKTQAWLLKAGTTERPVFGIKLSSIVGSATSKSYSVSSYLGQQDRIGIKPASAAAGLSGGLYHSVLNYSLTTGFVWKYIFCASDPAPVAGAITFVGMTGSIGLHTGTDNPSSLTNIIGIGADTADTNLSIIHNDASGTATKIDLGANYPAHTKDTDIYEITLSCTSNATVVNYEVIRRAASDGTILNSTTGAITTDLPALTQRLAFQAYRGNNTTALETELTHIIMVIETSGL